MIKNGKDKEQNFHMIKSIIQQKTICQNFILLYQQIPSQITELKCPKLEQLQMSQHAIEFVCGCISGWAQVLTMQPFQIVKVRLANQSLLNPTYNGIIDCVKHIYHEEGPLAFYKGTLSPLMGIGALVSLHFGTNELIKKVIAKLHISNQNHPKHHTHKLSMDLILFSGLVTGIPSALVVTPVDHMRIKMQAISNTKYKSSINVGKKIFASYGLEGLYQGFYPTILGEVIGLGLYFGAYEGIIRQFQQSHHNEPPSKTVSFFAGGIAGCLSWLFTYPLDYVKTLIQSDDPGQRKYLSATQAALMKYEQEGVRTFFKGLGVTMLRAFPVNGLGFVTFEYFRHLMTKKRTE